MSGFANTSASPESLLRSELAELEARRLPQAPLDIPVPSRSEQIQESVRAASEARRAELAGRPSSQSILNAAIARQTGAGVASATGIERDLATLSFDAIRERYGRQQGNQLISELLAAGDSYRSGSTGDRTNENVASDLVSGVGLGVANSLGGIGALGLGLVNDGAGTWAAEQLRRLNEAVQGTQSPALQNRRQTGAALDALSFRDNESRFERERESDGSFMAGLSRIGRDALAAGRNLLNDPARLSDVTAQGVGSVVAAGPLGRVLSGAAQMTGAALGREAAGSLAARTGLAALGQRLTPSSTAVGIGAMEAGGAYQQAVENVMGMSFEDLARTSDMFNELVATGEMTPEEARVRVAGQIGLTSAGVTAPAAVLAGRLVDRFEASPLRVGSLRAGVTNVGRETVEEGIQGSVSQGVQNWATQLYADNTQTLSEGVGEQLAQGALAGAGTAGVFQAPGIAGRAGLAAAQAVGNRVGQAAEERLSTLRSDNAAESPVSDQSLRQAGAEAAAAAPEAAAMVAEAAALAEDTGDATPEQRSAMETLAQQILRMGQVDPAELADERLPPSVRQVVEGATDRVDLVQRLAEAITQGDPTSQETFDRTMEMARQIDNFWVEATRDTEAFAAIPDNHPANAVVEQFNSLGARLQQSPKVSAALSVMQRVLEEQAAAKVKPVAEAEIETPEGQANIANALTLAAARPDKANLEANKLVLNHASNGRIKLTQAQFQALTASVGILEAAKLASDTQKALGHRSKMASVSDQITAGKGFTDSNQLSAAQYFDRIFTAMRARNPKAAKAEMAKLGRFVRHMQNKVQAVNQHYAGGTDKPAVFRALNPDKGVWYETKAPIVRPGSPGSVELAQRIGLEAQQLAGVYNGLSRAFPELGAGQAQVLPLHQDLQGKPMDVARAFQAGERVRPRPGSAPASVADVGEAAITTSVAPAAVSVQAQPTSTPAAQAVSRVSPESARKMTYAALDARLRRLREKLDKGTATDADERTLDVLDAERTRRESRAVAEEKASVERAEKVEKKPKAEAKPEPKPEPKAESAPKKEEPSKPVEAAPAPTPAPEPVKEEPAQPETVEKTQPTTEAETSQEATPKTLPERFSALVNPEKNGFLKAFREPKTAKSRLLGLDRPADVLRKAFGSEEALTEFLGGRAKKAISARVAKEYQAYLSLVPQIREKMEASLAKALAHQNQSGPYAGATLGQHLLDNGDPLSWPNRKGFNLVEQRPDGTLAYNQQLLDAAILAGLQWALLPSHYRTKMDAGAVASLTGIPEDRALALVKELDVGLSPTEAITSLATKVKDFWGLSENRTTVKGFTDGIPLAIAGELMNAMMATDVAGEPLLGTKKVELTQADGLPVPKGKNKAERTIWRYIPQDFNREVDGNKEDSALYDRPTLIQETVLIESPVDHYFNDDVPPVAPYQMRNPMVRNPASAKQAIEKANAIRYRLNRSMFDFYQELNVEGMQALFGGGDLDGRVMNEEHRKSLEGKNLSIAMAFRTLNTLHAEMGSLEEGKADPFKQDVRFAHNMSSVGRLQQLGPYTPQGNKQIREALLPTWSTVDLREEGGNPEHMRFWNIALGQALGIKVQAETLERINEKVHNLVEVKLASSVDLLRDWHESKKLPADAVAKLKENFAEAEVELTEAAVHALMEYARWTLANEQEKSTFTTAVYVEADGVTNGPVNAIHLLFGGTFSGYILNLMGKGGAFFTGEPIGTDQDGKPIYDTPTTMNEYRAKDSQDIYTKGAENVQVEIEKLRDSYPPTTEEEMTKGRSLIQEQIDHVSAFLSTLVPGVKFEEKDGQMVLTIERGVIKNPLTITLYGAGANGIAEKLVETAVEALYEKMSHAAESMASYSQLKMEDVLFSADKDVTTPEEAKAKFRKFKAAFDALITNAAMEEKEELFLVKTGLSSLTRVNPQTFKLSAEQLAALQDNMLYLFVKPMREGIRNTLGSELMDAAEMLRDTLQVQSLVLEHAFTDMIEKAVALKRQDPAYRTSDFLSQDELDQIMVQLEEIAPLVYTDMQTFFVAKARSIQMKGVNLGGDFEGRFDETPAFVTGPKNAGVKGMAQMNIGMGDGVMIQEMLNTGASGLPVFDGFNFALDQIAKGSVIANKAVFKSWQGNPLDAVHAGFTRFIQNLPEQMLEGSAELRDSLARVLLPPKERRKPKPGMLLYAMRKMEKSLRESADRIAINHQVMAEANLHVDQMAAAGQPYQHKGGTTYTGSNDDIAAALEGRSADLYTERAAKTREKNESNLNTLLSEGSTQKGNLRVLDMQQVAKLTSLLELPPNERQVLREILRSNAARGYKVVYGSSGEINAYRREALGISGDLQAERGKKGWINPYERTIYIINPGVDVAGTSETLVHELVHAATIEVVLAHYQGRDTGENPQVVGEAISRLETLMSQFLEISLTDVGLAEDATRNAFIDASNTIQEHLKNARLNTKDAALHKAMALNEYMAWSLANKGLVKLQKGKEASPLVRLIRSAIEALKKLIWNKRTMEISPGSDMFSNLLFNSGILMQVQPTIVEQHRDLMMSHKSRFFQGSDRIEQLNARFSALFDRHMDKASRNRQALFQRQMLKAADMVGLAVGSGFHMNMAETELFRNVALAMASEIELDGPSLARLDELYQRAVKLLKPEDFIDANDPDAQRAYNLAKMKFDLVVGSRSKVVDRQGRSSLLPTFIGLALVHEGFRDILRKLPAVEQPPPFKKATWDNLLTGAGNSAMDSLASKMSGQGNARNVQQAVDNIVGNLGETLLDKKTLIDTYGGATNYATNWVNDQVVRWVDKAADAVLDKTSRMKPSSPLAKAAVSTARVMAQLATEKNAGVVAEGVSTAINRMGGFVTVRELVNEMLGRTSSNAGVYDLIKISRSMVQQTRQHYREDLPTVIAQAFANRLSKREWSGMHLAMGKTDLAALTGSFSNQDVLAMLADPARRQAEIQTLENRLKTADPAHWSKVQAKSKQLAKFMMTGETGSNLLRNAEAVAELLGESTMANRPPRTAAYVAAVDQLVSLYALGNLSPETQEMVAYLVRDRATGMDFVLSYLTGQRAEETAKSASGMARFNAYKGYIPSLQQEGVHLIVADDSRLPELKSKSYVRVADYQGSPLEQSGASRGYYFAPVSARAAFNQGIMQNAQHTAGGVNSLTGYSVERVTGGRIENPAIVARFKNRMGKERNTVENLMPIYDETGEVVAFERGVDPVQLARLNQDTHLAKMIGVWRGRQVEEAMSSEFNKRLVDALHKMHAKDTRGSVSKQKEYVDLWDPDSYGNDPVIKDAMKLMTYETRSYVRSVFGDHFYVRKDLVNDVVGYRSASVRDAWSKISRWSPETQQKIQDLSMLVWGNEAYRKLLNFEQGWQNLMKDARTMIVVKSIIVPMANFASGMLQLLVRGVPMVTIAQSLPKKMVEIQHYTRGQLKLIEAEARLRAAEGAKDLNGQLRAKAEIRAIKDGWKRLSIWPLIQAGEFTAISDAGISREEILLTEGKLHAYIEKFVDRLPESVQQAGRYAVISKDTALFQGLQKSVQYGDFLSKAILYDHLTKKRGKTREEALGKITEEFVNYDRLAGRTRSYSENMGLTWFWAFKLRSIKVAVSMIRDNPVQALLGAFIPMPDLLPGSVGTPLDDNMLAKVWEGTLGFSVGPGMALRAPGLHPVPNLLF